MCAAGNCKIREKVDSEGLNVVGTLRAWPPDNLLPVTSIRAHGEIGIDSAIIYSDDPVLSRGRRILLLQQQIKDLVFL